MDRRRIVADMLSVKHSDFPLEYNNLKYLFYDGTISDWTRYKISTGIVPTNNTVLTLDIAFLINSSSSSAGAFGVVDNTSDGRFQIGFWSNKYHLVIGNASSDIEGNSNIRHTLTIDAKNKCGKFDDTSTEINYSSFDVNSDIALMGRNSTDSYTTGCFCKFYSATIYNGDQKIFEGIPVLRICDSKPIIYDLVTKNEFINSSGNLGYETLDGIIVQPT